MVFKGKGERKERREGGILRKKREYEERTLE